MYACLYAPEAATSLAAQQVLLKIAGDFSPEVERTAVDAVSFTVAPLRSIFGSYSQIAAAIGNQSHTLKVRAQVALATDLDTAILLARHCVGVTLAAKGEEARRLANIPLASLFVHEAAVDPALLEELKRWGLQTCEDLAGLPEAGVAERLGLAGVYLRKLALGIRDRPLRVAAVLVPYEETVDLEHPLTLLEPLLLVFGRVLGGLCERLKSQSQAARRVMLRLALEGQKDYSCTLEFAIPVTEHLTILKLLQLHLERHPPAAAVVSFTLHLEAAEPRKVQSGLFAPPTPQPDKLQVTLARIGAFVGETNVGTPQLLDSFRPGGFRLVTPEFTAVRAIREDPRRNLLRLSLRVLRPPAEARVRLVQSYPAHISASGIRGQVLRYAGPWKTCGEWWTSSAWNREEWDVALDDGALYRIYCELPAAAWYVHAIYD